MGRIVLLLALFLSPALADDAKDVTGVANAFFASYLKFLDKGGGYEETISWVEKSPTPTPEYKTALAKLYRDASKMDPELGYGADAVICGQDWPDKGYKAGRIWLAGPLAFVQMTSRDPKSDMTIDARFVKVGNSWRLDGTGSLSGGAFTAAATKWPDAELAEKIVGQWKEGETMHSFVKNGKWSTEAGVGTWKIKNGMLLRSTSEDENEPSLVYELNDSVLIFSDVEGNAHRLERVK